MKQEFVTYGIFYNPLKFEKIKTINQYLNKPAGGLWSSPVDSVWGWKDWCESEDYRQGYGLKFGFKFILKKSAKIFVIDSLSDYLRMPKKYFSDSSYDGKYYIDWEKLCMDYDGFLLTYNGFCETRFRGVKGGGAGFVFGREAWGGGFCGVEIYSARRET